MLLHLCSEVRLQGARRYLSAPIRVEGGWQAAKLVRLRLIVVFLEVVDESGIHVSVVIASVNCREQPAACPLVELPCSKPQWEDDSEEVEY